MRTLLSTIAGSPLHKVVSGPPLPLGIALFHGFAAVFVAAAPLEYTRSVLSSTEAITVMAAVVAVAAWRASPGAAAGIAGMGWLMLDGFVVHQYGDLAWDGSPDVVRLATLLIAALVASILHAAVLRVRRPRPQRRSVPRPRSPEPSRVRHQDPAWGLGSSGVREGSASDS